MVWIHPSWILLHGNQENVLLFVGGVQRQDAHHDEVREEDESGKTNYLHLKIICKLMDLLQIWVFMFGLLCYLSL